MNPSSAKARVALLVEVERPESPAAALRRAGYEVVRCSRPAEAFAALNRDFDAVFCDESFAPSSIRALFDGARRKNPFVLTGVVSPYSAVEDADLAAAFSADRVVRVPVRPRFSLRPSAPLVG